MMTRDFLRLIRLCCICGLMQAFLPAFVQAQEVEWRLDYGKARQEAIEKNRPLFIDVSTENCYYCKQLDLRTFKDPAIVALLNERCIPLKIDADHNAKLAEALRVEIYPTLVFATAEGKILGYQQGFIDVAPLHERLNKLFLTPAVAAAAANPNRDIDEAKHAIAAADYLRAIVLLKPIAASSSDAALQKKAGQLLQELEQQAAGRCAEARQLAENGKVPQAVETVTDLVRTYPGTKAAREGGQLLVTLASRAVPRESSRSRAAQEQLDQARADYQRRHYLSCLDRCENLIANYGDLNEGEQAGKLAGEIKSNPEYVKQACEQMGERLTTLYLSLAETCLKKGQPQQAIFYLERIVQTFPHTRNAEIAQVRLAQIQGPNRAPESKK